MANPSMTKHKLEVLRSMKDPARLVKSLEPDPTQEALFGASGIPAGRCLHRNSDGLMELGVEGREVPFWLFRGSHSPSTGWSGDAVTVAPGPTWQDGSEHVVLHFAGIEGLEISTTEFVADTYEIHDFVTAPNVDGFPDDDDKVAFAGVCKKAGVVYGKTPVVGVVIEKVYYKPHYINMLTMYTLYRPPIEGLPDGLTEPNWD